jgi:hypothetical protein
MRVFFLLISCVVGDSWWLGLRIFKPLWPCKSVCFKISSASFRTSPGSCFGSCFISVRSSGVFLKPSTRSSNALIACMTVELHHIISSSSCSVAAARTVSLCCRVSLRRFIGGLRFPSVPPMLWDIVVWATSFFLASPAGHEKHANPPSYSMRL